MKTAKVETDEGNVSPTSLNFITGARLTYISATTVRVGIAALQTCVRDDTNVLNLLYTGTLDAVITTVGAGGLQTSSSEAADTWYGVYIIGDTTGVNTPKILLIPDGTAFSESSYDVKRRIGWVRNNGSSNFIEMRQVGNGPDRTYIYFAAVTDRRPLNGGSATTTTAIDCSDFIPPTSQLGLFNGLFETGSSGAAADQVDIYDGDSSTTGMRFGPGFVSTFKTSFEFQLTLSSTQGLKYDVDQGGAAENRFTLYVNGFVDSI